MFEVLFIYPKVLARHQAGPAAVDRERYLTHSAGQGAAHGTLLRIARELLVIAERIDVAAGKSVTRSEIDAAARAWHVGRSSGAAPEGNNGHATCLLRWQAAWLRFLGILEDPPHSGRNAFYARRSHFVMCVQKPPPVAANTGAGPDLFWGYSSLPHLFPQKCVDVSGVAEYLGKKIWRLGPKRYRLLKREPLFVWPQPQNSDSGRGGIAEVLHVIMAWLAVRKGRPPDIVAKLNAALIAALAGPQVRRTWPIWARRSTRSAAGRRVVSSGQATVVRCDEQIKLDTRTTRIPFACPSCARPS
jgi:hypothetical protein